jgi:hypothetical protein
MSAIPSLKRQRKETRKQKRKSIRILTCCRGRSRASDRNQRHKIIILIAIEIIKKPLLPEKNLVFVSRIINGTVVIVGRIVPIVSFGTIPDLYIERIETLAIAMGFRETLRGQGTYLVVERQILQRSQVNRRKQPKTFSIMECRWHL